MTRIFMIDDDEDLVGVFQCVLEAEGYEFAAASSAAEGLARLDAVRPDLIILDVMLEDVAAGFRVVHALRDFDAHPANRRYAAVPILVLTGVQQRTKMRFSQDAGTPRLPVDAFVEKPVKPRTLLQKIAELLEKRPAHGPLGPPA
jgi:CheY-like chemotaxis protein